MERYIGKSLYGKFHQNTSPGDDTTWDWLKKKTLKKETKYADGGEVTGNNNKIHQEEH